MKNFLHKWTVCRWKHPRWFPAKSGCDVTRGTWHCLHCDMEQISTYFVKNSKVYEVVRKYLEEKEIL